METNELKITIPKGQEIDWKESAKQKKIILKNKDNRPRSWKEYCKTRLNSKETRFGYSIGNACDVITVDWDNLFNYSTYKDVLPTKELVEAFLAMMQLMSLRQDWIHKWSLERAFAKDWEPNWNKSNFCIAMSNDGIFAGTFIHYARPLSFPTQEMAIDFLSCFEDLLKVAKPLI